MKQNENNSSKIVIHTLLFLLGAALLVWGHYSNEEFKDKHGIEATSGATQLAD